MERLITPRNQGPQCPSAPVAQLIPKSQSKKRAEKGNVWEWILMKKTNITPSCSCWSSSFSMSICNINIVLEFLLQPNKYWSINSSPLHRHWVKKKTFIRWIFTWTSSPLYCSILSRKSFTITWKANHPRIILSDSKRELKQKKPGACWYYRLKAVSGWVRHRWHPEVYVVGCCNFCTISLIFHWSLLIYRRRVRRTEKDLSCRSKETCRLATELHCAWTVDMKEWISDTYNSWLVAQLVLTRWSLYWYLSFCDDHQHPDNRETGYSNVLYSSRLEVQSDKRCQHSDWYMSVVRGLAHQSKASWVL